MILLVPFPSALFNATLEDNYDEVMAGVNRTGRRLRALWLAILARLRGEIARRRQPSTATSATSPLVIDSSHPLGGPLPGSTALAGPELTPRSTAMVEPSVPDASSPPPAPTAEQVARDVWRTPIGIGGFVALSALLYSFLDPTFGFSAASFATLIGLVIGLFVILVAYGTPLAIFSRNHRLGLSVRALPATIAVAIICILVSRLSNFQPGYLYGLIVGFFFAHGVTDEIEGKAEAGAAGSSLFAALIAWIVLLLLRGSGSTDAFNALLQSAAVTVVVAGLENAVFAMLPLRFLPGAAVYGWNRRVWIALIGLGVFGFATVLLNPQGGGASYLANPAQTSFFTLIVLLVVLGLASVGFWAWFRFRPDPHRTEGPGL